VEKRNAEKVKFGKRRKGVKGEEGAVTILPEKGNQTKQIRKRWLCWKVGKSPFRKAKKRLKLEQGGDTNKGLLKKIWTKQRKKRTRGAKVCLGSLGIGGKKQMGTNGPWCVQNQELERYGIQRERHGESTKG